ncbi:Copper resistance protein CopC [Nostocoides japonicum T1-X7]|uniref:Copper resistance protein CopC n=1 Tax=Nostocoides japonicum T1-X7 TaxID=1194083 RepID=A0A077M627_9MICO|nr:copper resistance CopC family protein [Tetrasphaera japonica]CCH79619.1 Copper resistance protein CopC [Tetrasphaera japonica T1-X7]
MSAARHRPDHPYPARRILGIVLAGALLGLVPGLFLAGPADAHNVLVATSPADGSTVARTPAQVVLTFDQPALKIGTVLKVTGPSGDVTSGSARLVNNEVQQPLAPGAPAGHYTVAWRVTSADGHPVSGTFTFTSTKPGTGQATSAPATTSPTAGAASDSSGSRWWPWLVVAVVVLLALAGAVWLSATARARRGPSGP